MMPQFGDKDLLMLIGKLDDILGQMQIQAYDDCFTITTHQRWDKALTRCKVMYGKIFIQRGMRGCRRGYISY